MTANPLLTTPDAGSLPALFVWVPGNSAERNVFAVFRRTFELHEIPADAVVRLFADTSYHLEVNGTWVGTGPGRFATPTPEYDTHDLAHVLRKGANEIRVLVNHAGTSTYQTDPAGRPGFWAEGAIGSVGLETPGEWFCAPLDAWDPEAPSYSFAQGPIEICDTRLLVSEPQWSRPAVCAAGERSPWGRPTPYSGLPMLLEPEGFSEILLTAPVESPWVVRGFVVAKTQPKVQQYAGFRTYLHTPEDQTCRVACFWSELALNGEPVEVEAPPGPDNQGWANLSLKAGWNELRGVVPVLTERWAYVLGLPPSASIHLAARPDWKEPALFAISPVGEKNGITFPVSLDVPDGWWLSDGALDRVTPARLMAWERPVEPLYRSQPVAKLVELGPLDAPAATWCFASRNGFLGHVEVEVEAPTGSVLDVGTHDWARNDGAIAFYQTNPFTDCADRFVLRGGRQTVRLFHPRGGKYLQVTLRAPSGTHLPRLTLHSARVVSRKTLNEDRTWFHCGDLAIEYAWNAGMQTLRSSTDDAYSDSPWRERSSYVGDCLVNLHLNALLTADLRLARRVIATFATLQRPDGQIPPCTPSWLDHTLADFTLHWVRLLHDYWSLTGDADFVETHWPTVENIWSGSSWEPSEGGLWSADATRPFVDWGCPREEKTGRAHGVLNLLRLAAAEYCATLARVTGREASRFVAERNLVEAGLDAVLWHEEEGRLRASAGSEGAAVHTNILALAYRYGDMARRQRILDYLEPYLRANFHKATTCDPAAGHFELFYFFFVLPALVEHGRADLAETLIIEHYGYLRELGDSTLPECIARVGRRKGSRCHAWSGSAAIYAAHYILGLRPVPGQPDRYLFDPKTSAITEASGSFAHQRGPIKVSWSKSHAPQISVPDGVVVEIAAPAAWKEKTGALAQPVLH